MKRFETDILQKAEENIHGERVKNYGPAVESFAEVAAIASLLTKKELSPQDVLKVMISAKLVRNNYSPLNDDHRIDACGYLGLLDEVEKDLETARIKDEQKTMAAPKEHDYSGSISCMKDIIELMAKVIGLSPHKTALLFQELLKKDNDRYLGECGHE